MLSLRVPKLRLLLYRLRRHPNPHEALQLVHARLLGPLRSYQAEKPQAHLQASLVKLWVGQQVSLRLCLVSLNSSLTLLNAHLEHAHQSPMLLLEELPELQRPQAHEMLLGSLHLHCSGLLRCNVFDYRSLA